MWKQFDKLYFIGPSSLGDAFVYSAIVHYYAERCNELHYPIIPQYADTLTSLYKDVNNIIPIIFPSDKLQDIYLFEQEYCNNNCLSKILRPPIYADYSYIFNTYIPYMWDEQIYTLLELPFEIRYKNFRLPKNLDSANKLYNSLVSNNEKYILVHTGSSERIDGYAIEISTDKKVIDLTKPLSNNMLDYVYLIQNAEEIHCVPSAFYCLVDSIYNQTKGNLYYHDVRSSTIINVNKVWNNTPWKIIKYK
jgi:hypothetical protein